MKFCDQLDDNYILDGHHRWYRAAQDGTPLNSVRVNLPMKQLLKMTRNYPYVEYHTPSQSAKKWGVAADGPPDEARDQSGKWTREGGSDGAEKPQWKKVPLGKTTEDVFRNPETGEWDKDREAWHQKFAEDALTGKKASGEKPIATILGGGTASGKSTFSKQIMSRHPNDVWVDADSIKPKIPEYDEMRAQEGKQPIQTEERNPNLAASRVHEESSALAKLILAKAIANKLDVLYDATSSGGTGTLNKMITKLHDSGYKVKLVFADCPIGEAMQRAEMRAADPSDPAGFGRHIPAVSMRSTHSGSAANFVMIKDSPLIDTVKLYNTSGPVGTTPKLIYSRDENGKGQVHDAEKWKYYREKAALL